MCLLTTGAIDNFKVNNVYDMTGNVKEWKMECYSTNCRVMLGTRCTKSYYAAFRNPKVPTLAFNGNSAISSCSVGTRLSLYIKNNI